MLCVLCWSHHSLEPGQCGAPHTTAPELILTLTLADTHFSDEISFFINLVWKNHIWLQLIIDVEDVIYCNMLVSLTIYRSVFLSPLPAPAMLTGIVLSSVLMHRNSPETHMVVRQSRLMTHQVAERGGLPLYQLQHNKWRK